MATPGLTLAGASVPVLAYGQAQASAYVLLPPAQDTQSLTISTAHCQEWDCTLLVDVVTRHASGELSTEDADTLADLVSDRLDGNRLALPQGLQILRAVVEQVNGGDALDGEQVDIHRYLRLRYTLSLNS
jgi:hypothetical protein